MRRFLPGFTLAAAIAALYFYKLDGAGVLSSDEPRYAAIGIAMAQTGDFITPKLWGSPWFEKPPLLYWMTAAGSAAGLNVDLAGRFPVALLSALFLIACFVLLKREFGVTAAGTTTVMLATSAGWISYSSLCLTDIPLAVFFSLATFLCLPLIRDGGRVSSWRWIGIGTCLGLATLAKGLVPVALALPWAWFLRRYWRQWWIAALAFGVVALPWYVAVYQQNGYVFIQEFFVRHHFERLYSASLQHVQPWYYYLPVLLAGTFPWTPGLILVANKDEYRDTRATFLLATAVWGLLFFSISLNKLPGYLLPIMPTLFCLIGVRYQRTALARTNRLVFLACASLIALIPLLAFILPNSLGRGRITLASGDAFNRTTLFYVAAPLIVVWAARRAWVGALLALSVIAGALYLKAVALPRLDRQVSARVLWQQLKPRGNDICDAGTNRDWLYGLNFYRGSAIPLCNAVDPRLHLKTVGHAPPAVQ